MNLKKLTMRTILLLVLCFFLSSAVCFAQPKYPVSGQTVDSMVQLKQSIDIHLRDAFRDLAQFSSERRESVTQVLNYAVIISGQLDSLISILDQDNRYSNEEQEDDLTFKEVSKFIDYATERVNTIEVELNKRSQSFNQALIIHHIQKVKEFVQQTKVILSWTQSELKPSRK